MATKNSSNHISEVTREIIVPADNNEFIIKDKFVVDVRKEAKVKISYIGNNFLEWFMEKKEGSFPGSTLQGQSLLEDIFDIEILEELGGAAEITLREIYTILEQKLSSENTDYFIGYACDIYDELREVIVSLDKEGYDIEAYTTEYPSELYLGNIIYSRKLGV